MSKKIYHIISIAALVASLFCFARLCNSDFSNIIKALKLSFKYESVQLFAKILLIALCCLIFAISNSLAILFARIFYSDAEYNKRIAKMQSEKKQLEEQIKKLRDENEVQEYDLSEKDKKIEQLKYKLNNLEKEILTQLESDRRKLAEERRNLDKIKQNLADKEIKLNEREEKINKYLLKIKYLENKLSALQKKRDLRKKELEGLYNLFKKHIQKNAVLTDTSAYQAFKYLKKAKRNRLF